MRLLKIAPLLRADEDKSPMRNVIYKRGGNDDAWASADSRKTACQMIMSVEEV